MQRLSRIVSHISISRHVIVHPSFAAADGVKSPASFATGTQILSYSTTDPQGQLITYSLDFQKDSNLVLYRDKVPIWESDTNKTNANELAIQSDGNIVIYRQKTAIWNSRTNGKGTGPYQLRLRGEAVELYDDQNHLIWSSCFFPYKNNVGAGGPSAEKEFGKLIGLRPEESIVYKYVNKPIQLNADDYILLTTKRLIKIENSKISFEWPLAKCYMSDISIPLARYGTLLAAINGDGWDTCSIFHTDAVKLFARVISGYLSVRPKDIIENVNIPSTEPVPIEAKNAIKIATFNCGLIKPFGYDPNEPLMGNIEVRAENIGKWLVSQHSDVDIFCFQEVWDKPSSTKLQKQLSPIWSQFYAPDKNSGLLVCSRWPILDKYFEKWLKTQGDENWAEKGFLACYIEIPSPPGSSQPPRPIIVYNTHLHAGVGVSGNAEAGGAQFAPNGIYRDMEFGAVYNHMQQWRRAPKPHPNGPDQPPRQFFCGDVNSDLYDFHKIYGVSYGKTPRRKGMKDVIKYGWMRKFFKYIDYVHPSNFRSPRIPGEVPSDRPANMFIGTDVSEAYIKNARSPKPTPMSPLEITTSRSLDKGGKLLDLVGTTPRGVGEKLMSQIEVHKGLSDHLMIKSCFLFGN